jgi:integrase/recombinase XerD
VKRVLPTTFASALRAFFSQHLPLARGLSPRTLLSYRDSFVLLLRFLAARHHCAVVDLEVEQVTAEHVLAFLDHLETDRKNSVATRNARLAAVHAFARFLATRAPEHVDVCQRLLAVPTKRGPVRPVDYLEADEVRAMLDAASRPRRNHVRDRALLLTLFNTGARVQELLDIHASDVHLERPTFVRLCGKECHAYCISFRPRNETTGTHAGRQACDLASSAADVLPVVRRGIGVDPYTNALGASRVPPISEPWAA